MPIDFESVAYTDPEKSEPETYMSLLGELGRATTAYHEATPDCIEAARDEYERVLRTFNRSLAAQCQSE
jgi:hypothetical protein